MYFMNEHRPPPPPVRVDSISGHETKPLPRLPDDELNKKKKTNSKGQLNSFNSCIISYQYRLDKKRSIEINNFTSNKF